jgi:hypothetical protein
MAREPGLQYSARTVKLGDPIFASRSNAQVGLKVRSGVLSVMDFGAIGWDEYVFESAVPPAKTVTMPKAIQAEPSRIRLQSEIARLKLEMQKLQDELECLQLEASQQRCLMASIASQLDPVTITVVDDGQTHLMAREPLVLPVHSPEGIVEFSHPRLGILAHSAESYEDAEQAIVPSIAWLWRSYALAEDSELSSDAVCLKRALIEMFEES